MRESPHGVFSALVSQLARHHGVDLAAEHASNAPTVRQVSAPAPSAQDYSKDGYLSDDQDLHLRELGPPPCQGCRLFAARRSAILDHVVLHCGVVPEQQPGAELLSEMMLRLARVEGACPRREALQPPA